MQVRNALLQEADRLPAGEVSGSAVARLAGRVHNLQILVKEVEIRNVYNPFDHSPDRGRTFRAAHCLLRQNCRAFRPSHRHCLPSRARRPRTAGYWPRAFPNRNGSLPFRDAIRPDQRCDDGIRGRSDPCPYGRSALQPRRRPMEPAAGTILTGFAGANLAP